VYNKVLAFEVKDGKCIQPFCRTAGQDQPDSYFCITAYSDIYALLPAQKIGRVFLYDKNTDYPIKKVERSFDRGETK
jgi:hypothetical protein